MITKKIENFLRAIIEELENASSTSWENESEDLRAFTWDAVAITGIKLAGSESYIK